VFVSFSLPIVLLIFAGVAAFVRVAGSWIWRGSRLQERQAQWIEWSESLPKRTSATDVRAEEYESVPIPPDLAGSEITSDASAEISEVYATTHEDEGVIFDKQDQLDKG
jgi:hypothetical protein